MRLDLEVKFYRDKLDEELLEKMVLAINAFHAGTDDWEDLTASDITVISKGSMEIPRDAPTEKPSQAMERGNNKGKSIIWVIVVALACLFLCIIGYFCMRYYGNSSAKDKDIAKDVEVMHLATEGEAGP